MRTDSQMQSSVVAELEWDPSIRAQDIGVMVNDSIVTLTGSVLSLSEKLAAEAAVRRVAGVSVISEELKVTPPGSDERDDAAILADIASTLDWNSRVPPGMVTCVVEGGAVVLGGTVDWNYQRVTAYKAVCHIQGVRSVTNRIVVRVRPPGIAAVKKTIVASLKRLALRDTSGISVRVRGTTVFLEGKVQSWSELKKVLDTVWSAPGITDVDNNLVVFY